MERTKNEEKARAALIGDVIASRAYDEQQILMRRVRETLAWVNGRLSPTEPLALTVGDEFQASYATLHEALHATALIRLRLFEDPGLRFGIGWGDSLGGSLDEPAAGRSGSAWWRARRAIEKAKTLESERNWPRTSRTVVVTEDAGVDGPLNAFLVARDHLIARMDETDAAITLGLFEERTQTEIARELGLSQSNVSRRQADNGPSAVFRAHTTLEGGIE